MDAVAAHYSDEGLHDRILSAIAETGIPPERLTIDDLAPADEFHIGGRVATEALVGAAGLPPSGHVLDLGSGLGGTARYLAASHGHQVTGVDFTQEYVAVAQTITRLLRMEDRVRFARASVLNLPFPNDAFDAAVQLHVGMNIADKATLIAEVRRVLRPGGVYAIYDVMGPPGADVDLPVPWASTPADSHLVTPDRYVTVLEAASFRVDHVRDRRDFAVGFFRELMGRSGPPPQLGLHLVMGAETATKLGNVARAVERGAVAPVEIVAVAAI
jgi:SAM-dependent methyltransferase